MKSRIFLMLVGLAALVVAGLLAFLLPGSKSPNIVLITVDTLRADHLGTYGAKDVRTPHIDRLAADSTVFENAACPMTITRPSITSLFTSHNPQTHKVLNNTLRLAKGAHTLTKTLKGLGYQTGAFPAVILLGPGSGVTQGFDRVKVPSDRQIWVPAKQVVSGTLEWLNSLPKDRRFFVWLHLFDPHQPYNPDPPFRPSVDPELDKSIPRVNWANLLTIARKNRGDIPASILEHAKALYRGEVEYVDHWIGKLIEGLAARGSLDDTLVILTADHGECFENGVFFEHAICLGDGATRIPLLVRYPALFGRGQRIQSQASIMDIAPTLLKILGQPVPADYQGKDLRQLQEDHDRHVLLQYPYFHSKIHSWHAHLAKRIKSVAGEKTVYLKPDKRRFGLIGRTWKYLAASDQEELFRLAPKLDEKTNLAASHPQVLARMRLQLKKLVSKTPDPKSSKEPTGDISEEELERLRSLGYVQ